MNDMENETKPKLPLYSSCTMNIKEVNDPDPPFFTLTSNVKTESDGDDINVPYFDHSFVIQHNLKTEPEDADGNSEDPLYCAPFGETAETCSQVLDSSKKTHTGERSFCCLLCNQSFSVKEDCELQMTCEKCFATTSRQIKPNAEGEKRTSEFETGGKGSAHMSTHNASKSFMCETCGKCFSVNRNLIAHIRTHTGERPFKCETCGKGFTLKTTLRDHIKTHTGDKSFKCDTCGKSFLVKQNLRAHMSTHNADKPYKCETCGMSFTSKRTLIGHMSVHTGKKPFKCDTCEKCFSFKCNLTAHVSTHDGEKSFQCETCGKSFKFKRVLTIHVRTHTGDTLQN